MAGRELAFSDPEVIRLASERFVPIAENVSILQWVQDAEGEYFRLVAEQGHYAGRTFPTSTRQGYYAFTPDGTLLAARNSRDPRQMEDMMLTALRRWSVLTDCDGQALTPAVLPDFTPALPSRYPEGGLVLQLATRDLPREVDTRRDDWRKQAWNLDYAWITRDEARSLVPASLAPGARQQAPWEVVRRLARFHLRDFVRGEPPSWPVEAIRQAEVESVVQGVSGDRQQLVRLSLSGSVRLQWEWRWMDRYRDEERTSEAGLELDLSGEATWDKEQERFVVFDLLAAGPRWGASQHNNRGDDLGPAPLAIAFVLAGNEPRDRTPPHTVTQRGYFNGG
ncbi:MAG: hypothetical protein ACR2JY_17480 [Chloroflexota bacterium]